jgi:hypothetical protein
MVALTTQLKYHSKIGLFLPKYNNKHSLILKESTDKYMNHTY